MGLPRNADFSPYMVDGKKGLLAIYIIDPTVNLASGLTSGCSMVEVVMVDVTMSHYP